MSGQKTCRQSYTLNKQALYGGLTQNRTWQEDAVQRAAAREVDVQETRTEADAEALRELTWLYKSFCERRNRSATPLAVAVLDPYNLLFIKREVERQLTELSGDNRVKIRVNLDREMGEYIVETVLGNQSLLPTAENVGVVNRVAIGRIVHQWYYGLRQRGLYQRYFLDDNRLKNMDLPEYTGGKRGRYALDPSGYALAPSGSRYYESYLQRVMNLRPSGTPGKFCQTRVQAKGPNDCFAAVGDFRSG